MSERSDSQPGADEPHGKREPYVAPSLRSVGNARELLEGLSGSVDDMGCPFCPTRSS